MKFKTSLLIGAAAVAATSLLAVTSHAKNLRWKMQSTWGSQVAINGESAVYFSNKVKSLSDGKVQLRFHEPNALVPSLEVWDAVKNGSVDAGYTTPGYHAGKILLFLTLQLFHLDQVQVSIMDGLSMAEASS